MKCVVHSTRHETPFPDAASERRRESRAGGAAVRSEPEAKPTAQVEVVVAAVTVCVRRVPRETLRAIAEAYARGDRICDISQRHGVTEWVVRRAVKQLGVPVRGTGRPRGAGRGERGAG